MTFIVGIYKPTPTTLCIQYSSLFFHCSYGSLCYEPSKLWVSVSYYFLLIFTIFQFSLLYENFFLYLTHLTIIMHACTQNNVNRGYFMNLTVYINKAIIKLSARAGISATILFRKHIHFFSLFFTTVEKKSTSPPQLLKY